MAVHLLSKKPIIFPPADSDHILAPPASGTTSEHGDDILDPDTIDLQFKDDTTRQLPTVVTLKDGTYKSGKVKTQWLDNSFQKALLRAQERLAGGSYPREQEEWRLPHAPVPSRPDFSRVVPVRDERVGRRKRRGRHKRRDTYPATGAKEKTSEPEYILPPLPIQTMYQNALSDMAIAVPSTKLTKNIITSAQPVYLPFVGSASLHPKSLTTTVRREPPTTLPGLCHGCRGLTHLHDFKGYLYLDSDDDEGDAGVSESGRGGSLYDDETEEEGMMGAVGLPVGTTACPGCVLSETPHFHYNTVDAKPIDTPPPSQFSSNDSGHYDSIGQSYDLNSVASPDHIDVTIKETIESSPHEEILFSAQRITEPDGHRHQQTIPRQKPPKIPQWILDLVKDPHSENASHKIKHYEDHCYACQQALRQLLPQLPLDSVALRQLLPEYNQPGKFLGDDLENFKYGGPTGHGDNSEVASTSGIGTSVYSEAEILKLEEEERLQAEEEDAKERERREQEKQKEEEKEQEKEQERIKKEEAEKERKKNLYKAPKGFKIKKQEHQVTTGEDPFSKERSYNIPKTKGFQVKKSDKALTAHVEIERDESSWNQPKKFELAKGPKKLTKSDWKFSDKKERLRPPTPPPPPPPVKKKSTTVPIVPKKREPPEQIASLREPVASPPRKRKVEEKPKAKPKPDPPPPPPPKEKPPPPPPPPVQKKTAEPKKITKLVKLPSKLIKKSKKVAKARKEKKRMKKKKKLKEKKVQPTTIPEEQSESDSDSSVSSLSSSPSLESLSTPPITPSQIPLPPSPPPTASQIPLPASPPAPTPSQISLPSSPPITPSQIPLPPSPPRSPTPPPPPKEPTPPPPKEPTPPPPKEPTPVPPKEPTPVPPKEPTPPPQKEPTPLPPKEPTPLPPKEPTPPPPKPEVALPKPKATVSKPAKPKKAKPKREKKKAVANRKVINKPKPAFTVLMELGKNLPSIQVENFIQLEEHSQPIKPDTSQSHDTNLRFNKNIEQIRTPQIITSHLRGLTNLPKKAWSTSGHEKASGSDLSDEYSNQLSFQPKRTLRDTKKHSGDIEVKHFPLNMPAVSFDDFIIKEDTKPRLEEIQREFVGEAQLGENEPESDGSEIVEDDESEDNDLEYSADVESLAEQETDDQYEIMVPKVEPPSEPAEEEQPETEDTEDSPQPEAEEVAVPAKKSKIPKLPKAMFKKKLPLVIKEFVRKERKTTAAWMMPAIPKWKDGSEDMPSWPEDAPPELRGLMGGPPPLPDIPLPKPALPPPPEPEVKPNLPPAPKVKKKPEPIIWRKRPEYKPKKRKMRAVRAETPEPELESEFRDALDFLAKYCIVHKDRVPHYAYVFNNHLEKKGIITASPEPLPQSTVRHRLSSLSSAGSAPANEEHAGEETLQETNEEIFEETFGQTESDEMNEANYVSPLELNATGTIDEETASDDGSESNGSKPVFVLPPHNSLDVDGHLDKLAFTIGNLFEKIIKLDDEILQLKETKKSDLAEFARQEFPEILRADYNPDTRVESPKKKKSKKKKTKGSDAEAGMIERADNNSMPSTPVRLCTPHVDNDDWVLGRLNKLQNDQLESIPEVRTLNLRLDRAQEKLFGAKERMRNLTKEKDVVSLMGNNLKNEEASTRPAANEEFRRKQSSLYKNMNPEEVYDIGVTDVEPLLRQVNRYLITEKECQYVYHVLDLPQRHHLDFKLFTVVAALSEKVSNLEPFIRKMINKMDFEALDVKMNRAKELFYLLEDEDSEFRGSGEVPLYNMKVELEAGGLSPDHVQMVIDKLGREGKLTVDFLDFLTYILLFIDIHDYILSDPLNSTRDR